MFSERFSDAGNAIWFAKVFGDNVRYVREHGRWIVNAGTHWRVDVDGEVERLAKQAIASIFVDLANPELTSSPELREARSKHALKSEQAPRLLAAISLLKSEPGITISAARLDTDAHLLGVRGGVIDLRTGALRQPRGDEYVCRQAHAEFREGARCPTWLRFLDRIMANDGEMIAFLQRAVGYSLTGDTREQAVFICHGGGSNGKSVFLRTIRELLGAYGADANADTFLERRDGVASNDLARLAGARLVAVSEIDEGKRLAESLVKAATGGEAISARFLYAEYFSFVPTFKLWLAVNHKPSIRGDDNGIWRRIRLVPFRVTIAPDEQDKELLTKLRLELPGILNWALDGCAAWRRDGLAPPIEVTRATAAYRAESDAIGEWIAERCTVGGISQVQAKTLYDDYRAFTEARGGMALSMRRWAQRLADRGFQKDEGRVVHYRGIALCALRDHCDQFPGTSSYTHTCSDLPGKRSRRSQWSQRLLGGAGGRVSKLAHPAILEPTVLAILGRAADLARSAERTHARRMLQDLRNGRIAPADVPTWTPSDEHQPTRRQASAASACPDCDHEAIIALWGEVVPGLPQPLRWTAERQALLRARWRDFYLARTRHGRPCVRDDLLRAFRGVFEDVTKSPFLMGQIPGRDGRPPFRCTLEWLLRPGNFTKHFEGAYERRT